MEDERNKSNDDLCVSDVCKVVEFDLNLLSKCNFKMKWKWDWTNWKTGICVAAAVALWFE